jgi:predicted amidophosphoribosyltransferase
MKRFTIKPNEYLQKSIQAFYHSDYFPGSNWKINGTFENFIWTLKNDDNSYSDVALENAILRLSDILFNDLPKILQVTELNKLLVCVVPRSYSENRYEPKQLLFRSTVKNVVEKLDGFIDGTNFILRHTDTDPTHLGASKPAPGTIKRTCILSDNVIGKDILLIDDVYTYNKGIDEDALQALLDKGAGSIFFYAIGKTVK